MDVDVSKLLSPECICLDLKGKKKKEIVEELIELFVQSGKISQGKGVIEEVLDREKETSTGIGKGVAIPHKLMRGISGSMIGFGRKKIPVNFDSFDGKPVDLFFLLLGPEGSANTHLRLLSKLSRYAHNDDFLAALREAETPAGVIAVFEKEEAI